MCGLYFSKQHDLTECWCSKAQDLKVISVSFQGKWKPYCCIVANNVINVLIFDWKNRAESRWTSIEKQHLSKMGRYWNAAFGFSHEYSPFPSSVWMQCDVIWNHITSNATSFFCPWRKIILLLRGEGEKNETTLLPWVTEALNALYFRRNQQDQLSIMTATWELQLLHRLPL